MNEWRRVLTKVLRNGVERPDRTGTGTLACFGEQLVFENRWSFPAVTLKRLAFGQVKSELASFLKGHSNLADFHGEGCTIWDGNGMDPKWKERARYEGDLGRIYGVQWRDWVGSVDGDERTVDQLAELLRGMAADPYGRRHLVTAWNPAELDEVCLPPCHVMFQAFVYPSSPGAPRDSVDLRVDMRSVDLFLGLPFDVASYALLQRLLCKTLGLDPGFLVFHLGDAHIYRNHVDQVQQVLAREEMEPPQLWLDDAATLLDFSPEQAELRNYNSHPAVPAPLNV